MWNISYRKLILLTASIPTYEYEDNSKDNKKNIKDLIKESGGIIL